MIRIQTGVKNEILRKISEPILPEEMNKYIKIGKDMVKYIKNPEHGGVGLAAPQIGINKRLFAICLLKDKEDENFPTIMMINPEIIEKSIETEIDEEGCLSVPGKKGKVERFKTLKIQYIDENKKTKILVLKGFTARIFQHELDHLDGVLFVDKVK